MSSDGVIGSKKELARALGTSVVSLDRWLERFGDEVPCLERGTNGRAYRFDIAAAVAFFQGKREEEAARQADRDNALAQLALPFLQPAQADLLGGGAISLKDQRDALIVARMKREEAERLGALVPAEDVKNLIATAFTRWNRLLHATWRQSAADHKIPDHITRAIDAKLAGAQREFVREFRAELLPEPDAA